MSLFAGISKSTCNPFLARLAGGKFQPAVDVDASSRRTVCRCPSCSPLPSSAPRSVPGDVVRWNTSVRAAAAALPQGPSLHASGPCHGPITSSKHTRLHSMVLSVESSVPGDRRDVDHLDADNRFRFDVDLPRRVRSLQLEHHVESCDPRAKCRNFAHIDNLDGLQE